MGIPQYPFFHVPCPYKNRPLVLATASHKRPYVELYPVCLGLWVCFNWRWYGGGGVKEGKRQRVKKLKSVARRRGGAEGKGITDLSDLVIGVIFWAAYSGGGPVY